MLYTIFLQALAIVGFAVSVGGAICILIDYRREIKRDRTR